MGMADLKKAVSSANRQRLPPTSVSIEDFIEESNLYAMGQLHGNNMHVSAIYDKPIHSKDIAAIPAPLPVQPLRLITPLALELPLEVSLQDPQTLAKNRNATFSLSEDAIKQLSIMAGEQQQSKSKIIRQLIQAHYQLSPQQRAQLSAPYHGLNEELN
ncbi:ribbon-helix-helix protein, CopG family [Shewanella sp. SNU WT4]|uniref:ribbon-helix-helix protein, CopG family n=1 Tax=Shewanella sp. SNU WT4 TaxID=2590015 RepID=UPI00143DA524|nr:ribbon-helix-helix protein, CopG family [Shewanella sp. SNU WT4]